MKNVVYIILTILCIQCSHSAPTKTMIVDKDTVSAVSNIDRTTNPSTESEITCPKCGHQKIEKLPTEVCLVSYTCENCKEVLHPKDDDCCVFCTYGSHKCPSKQGS